MGFVLMRTILVIYYRSKEEKSDKAEKKVDKKDHVFNNGTKWEPSEYDFLMILAFPWDEPIVWGGLYISKPITLIPFLARLYTVELPWAPKPITNTSAFLIINILY